MVVALFRQTSVSLHKPDMVIIDKKTNTLHVIELSVPFELNIEQRHTDKSNKYAHFTTDITDYNCTVETFEVSSQGYLTSQNHTTLATLHKFINPSIKF